MTGWTKYYPVDAPFVADPHTLVRNTGRQIDWQYVPESYRSTYASYIVKLSAASAIDDTSLDVDALPIAIPAGTTLYFGEAKELVLTTATAPKGAIAIAVQAIPTALEDNDEATYIVPGGGQKELPAGTVMAQLAAAPGKIVPRANRPGSETAIGLLETSVSEDDSQTGVAILVGGVIYENMLPETITGYKSELVAAGVGLWVWQTYVDSRAS